MAHASAFSPTFEVARQRFVTAARAAHWHTAALPYGDNGLSIDVAWRGAADPACALVVSSGLHGVEGHLGSAVQLSLLEAPPPALPEDGAVVLLHALNPYGFANTRRVDADNIDLNRNFLLKGEAWSGAPPLYGTFDPFFNPTGPDRLGRAGFYPRAVGLIAWHGMTSLKNTLPVGQYAFPRGLFYGGSGPSLTQRVLNAHLNRWLGHATKVTHLDLHTGIGQWGTYKLFPNHQDAVRTDKLRDVFGADVVEGWDPSQTSYAIRGGLGEWLAERFPSATYDLLTAEFGTYHVLRIVQALREENRAHQTGDARAMESAKANLREKFAPASTEWRERCLVQASDLISQAHSLTFEGA